MSLYYICPDGLGVLIYVQPGAKKSAIDGSFDGRLKIRIAGPPVDGKANKELKSFLAEHCGVSKSRVLLVKGEKSRKKEVILKLEPDSIDCVLRKLELKG